MIIEGLNIYEYHARPETSSSDIRAFMRSPAHYKYKKENPKPPTDAMKLGSVAHSMLLEPDTFSSRYFIIGDRIDGRTKAGKEQREAVKEKEQEGFEVLFTEQVAQGNEIVNSVRSNVQIAELINHDAKNELTIISEIDGMPVKCRPDRFSSDRGILIDVKTTNDASEWKFQRSAYELGYHIQMAFYEDIITKECFTFPEHVIIAIENEPPYVSSVFRFTKEAMKLGRETYMRQLQLLKECQEYDSWPGYGDNLKWLDLPVYAYIKEKHGIPTP